MCPIIVLEKVVSGAVEKKAEEKKDEINLQADINNRYSVLLKFKCLSISFRRLSNVLYIEDSAHQITSNMNNMNRLFNIQGLTKRKYLYLPQIHEKKGKRRSLGKIK